MKGKTKKFVRGSWSCSERTYFIEPIKAPGRNWEISQKGASRSRRRVMPSLPSSPPYATPGVVTLLLMSNAKTSIYKFYYYAAFELRNPKICLP